MTLELELAMTCKGVLRDVTVLADFEPGSPGVRYHSDGSGTPPDPPEVFNVRVTHLDGVRLPAPLELTDEGVDELYEDLCIKGEEMCGEEEYWYEEQARR